MTTNGGGLLDRTREALRNASRGSAHRAAGAGVDAPLARRDAVVLAASTLVAALLVTFVLEVSLVGMVRHARAQEIGYHELRSTLAAASTPVGQTDVDGHLVQLGAPIAEVEIPVLGVREVVFEGTSSAVLVKGPGHRRDTPLPGQAGTSLIFGRQAGYGGPFRGLSVLRPGDAIAVTTGQGRQLFAVDGIRRAGEDGKTALPGTSHLVLVSTEGWPFLAGRVIRVDATLIGKPVATPGMAFGPQALPKSENAMQGDSSSAVSLLLYAELLFIVGVGCVLLRSLWGRWHTWIVVVPVLAFVALQTSHELAMFLPNLM